MLLNLKFIMLTYDFIQGFRVKQFFLLIQLGIFETIQLLLLITVKFEDKKKTNIEHAK